ncbi:hypothetical protein G3I44_00490 [Halogeometricum borinquense]|uniref:Uncharacterized protein n=1 Tax=Halogeometricum borinquense TaxID=60847 RepID=A0A6C0UCB9_9EURY|nr:hypothetical protein [Halogeometricum borinquense]QIB72895.1 hypothetical protein G3I44_00490 [Halogeometricum borinquense]
MVFSPHSPIQDILEQTIDNAVVYADADKETILHEGSVRILANGWVEVSSGRLISPSAVHHIDKQPSE